jgi:hypothetical protein
LEVILAYAPKNTAIVDAIITSLTAAGGTGKITTPILCFTKHHMQEATRFPICGVWCASEESRDSAHILIDGLYDVHVGIAHAQPEFLGDAVRLMAHECRRVLTTASTITDHVDVGPRWSINYFPGYSAQLGLHTAVAEMQFHYKYKEQR